MSTNQTNNLGHGHEQGHGYTHVKIGFPFFVNRVYGRQKTSCKELGQDGRRVVYDTCEIS